MHRPAPKLLGLVLGTGLLLASPASRAEDAPRRPIGSTEASGPSKEEYKARRTALMQEIKQSEAGSSELRAAIQRAVEADPPPRGSAGVVVVLVGAGEPGDDARFRQENDFHYLTGVDQPFATVILHPESGEETLYLPPRDRTLERWVGPRLGPGPAAGLATGFDRVESTAGSLADLFRAVADPGTGDSAHLAAVYLLEPSPKPASATPAARLARLVREGAPSSRFHDLAPLVHEMRKRKSEAEVALIRGAIRVTANAHLEAIRLLRPKVLEARLEGAILDAFAAGGASRAGFPSIVGSGPNSTIFHYNRNDRDVEAGDLVVVDIGGEYRGYSADITRTYPADGRYSPRQREVYQLVLDAQTAAVAAFRPGVSTIEDLDRLARDVFRKSPLRARDADGVEQSMDHFFPHGIGHHLGLDVHDVGDASKPLRPGEVFTIEPGLYIDSEALGVRIEDDYRVEPGGLEKLSRDIPVEIEEIERAMARVRAVGTPPTLLPTPGSTR